MQQDIRRSNNWPLLVTDAGQRSGYSAFCELRFGSIWPLRCTSRSLPKDSPPCSAISHNILHALFPQLQLWQLNLLCRYNQRALHFETVLRLLKRIGVWMANTDGASWTVTGTAFIMCCVTVRSELRSAVRLMMPCIQWLAVCEAIWL